MTVVAVIDIGNFSNEITYFYQADSGGCFNDQTIQAKVGNPSLFTLTFGLSFFDSNQDGSQDLFYANGHIEPDVSVVLKEFSLFTTPSLLFWNQRNSQLSWNRRKVGRKDTGVGRGVAYGDYDVDSDLDLLVSNSSVIVPNGQA